MIRTNRLLPRCFAYHFCNISLSLSPNCIWQNLRDPSPSYAISKNGMKDGGGACLLVPHALTGRARATQCGQFSHHSGSTLRSFASLRVQKVTANAATQRRHVKRGGGLYPLIHFSSKAQLWGCPLFLMARRGSLEVMRKGNDETNHKPSCGGQHHVE